MSTLLWLAVGTLVALLTWVVSAMAIVVPLVILALVILGFLVPREVTAAGAKVGVGFGATYLVLFGPNLLRDPMSATGAAYLLFGGGLVILVLGLAAVVRNRLRRRREREALIAQL